MANWLESLKLSSRMLWRDWRSGELNLLLVALVLAVAAVSSVGFLSDRVQRGLERDAVQLLGADLVIQSDRPLPDSMYAWAHALKLRTLSQLNFPSMIQAPGSGRVQLASVKAVETGYPLRGAVQITDKPGGHERAVTGGPVPGTLWVDAQILSLLGVSIGDSVKVGEASLRLAHIIAVEPDRGLSFVNLAPRVLMSQQDLAATQLLQPGSRVTYRLMVAGTKSALNRYQQDIEPRLSAGQRLESLDNARPELKETLNRAKQFLSLTALLTAFIAGVAIFLAARRYVERHWSGVALMRCLGASRRQLLGLFGVEFLGMAAIGALAGGFMGWLAHYGLLAALSAFLPTTLPSPSWRPLLQALGLALLLSLACILAPLAGLREISPTSMLRKQDSTGSRTRAGVLYGVSAALLLLLLTTIAQNIRLGAWTGFAFASALVGFMACSWITTQLLAPLLRFPLRSVCLRFALAGLVRRRGGTIVQIAAIALGLMAMLMMTLSRNDLIQGWERSLSPDAPNRYIINIQPDQRTELAHRLSLISNSDVQLSPMVRGRLVQRNGIALRSETYTDDRARRLLDREFNLSYQEELPAYNQIEAGRWLDPQQPEVSMETGIAKTLGLQLGDRLTFDVAGTPVAVKITSLRTLAWDSMRVNFFAILSPQVLRDAPATYITALHVKPTQATALNALLTSFPNLTIIDTGVILRQLQVVLRQVAGALQYLFIFALLAGALVLYTALAASRDGRIQETALLRALGASARQLRWSNALELSLVGILAGVLAAAGAWAATYVLATQVFGFDLSPDPRLWLIGPLAGWACAAVGGWWALQDVLRQPAWLSLREV